MRCSLVRLKQQNSTVVYRDPPTTSRRPRSPMVGPGSYAQRLVPRPPAVARLARLDRALVRLRGCLRVALRCFVNGRALWRLLGGFEVRRPCGLQHCHRWGGLQGFHVPLESQVQCVACMRPGVSCSSRVISIIYFMFDVMVL